MIGAVPTIGEGRAPRTDMRVTTVGIHATSGIASNAEIQNQPSASAFDRWGSAFSYILSGTLMPRRSRPRCNTRAVRLDNARRELRSGSSDYNTGQASEKAWKLFASSNR